MGHSFADKVFSFTEENTLFSAPCHLLVGVSGGADSMSLLHCLCHWPQEGLRLTAVHIHHGLRGDTADQDAEFVQKYCTDSGIDCVVRYVDVGGYAAAQRMSVEEAGRCLRYDVFENIRREIGADYILTAHTADDQAETVLMRILRGCGTDGLSGIPAVRGEIRRPLLCCTRAEVEQYCAAYGVPYRTDETNSDIRYTRNRIRCEVLPHLRQVNPAVDAALVRLSQHAAADADLLRSMAQEALHNAQQEDGWSIAAFLIQPSPIRRRMISLLLRSMQLSTIEESYILAIERSLESNSGKTSLPGGITAVIGQGVLRLLPTSLLTEKTADIVVDALPFSADFGGYAFTLSAHTAEESENVHRLFLNAALDYDTIQGGLYVRCRREGDYMHPSGRRIGKSIKKLMNEWKIPEHVRDLFPLVCDDAGVVLVPGYACDERVKPTADTKHFLVWHNDAVKA